MKDNFDLFFRRKPALMLVALKKNTRMRYGSVLAKEIDCTYSHAVKILQTLEELKLEKEDVLVVGDSLQSDIYPAKKMGIKAILVDRKNKRDYELKITSLNELPELIKRLNKNAAELKGN